ncbi:MAG: type II/IV secretion system protein [Candidatus Eremiobacteraeota bacterium]|nr:type II/IV secretion system protein [Candidatus Eremiobacteraeota bacterium]
MRGGPAATRVRQSQRRYRRRLLEVAVSVRTDSGKAATGTAADIGVDDLRLICPPTLVVGERGFANLTLASGEQVRTPVEVMWKRSALGPDGLYGLQFRGLEAGHRSALLEEIYAPGGPLSAAVFDSDDSDRAPAGDHNPVSADHARYYLRLIRRLEQVHKLSAHDSDRLLFARLQQNRSLPDALVEHGLIRQDGLETFMSAIYQVAYINLEQSRPDLTVSDAIPVGIATSQHIVPVRRTDGKIVVAMADPLDLPTLDLLQMRNRNRIEIRFALIEDIERAINAVYHAASLHSVDRLFNQMGQAPAAQSDGDGTDVEDLETLQKMSDATPIITLVDSVLRSAVEDRASDIHIEPFSDKISVRFRLDGVLREMRTLPKNVCAAVTSRIKIMARMDITVRHAPQDGRASMRYNKKDFDLRIASLPTVYGEKIVIRLLEKNPAFKTLKAVGFNDENYELFAPLVHRPYGMILSCGPTGSGKSTTLFACLQEMNDRSSNITTIEDPVEYRVAGVNQVEVNAKRGLTSASVLRSLLRQDPDVIYVGEIRDRETADLAVRAALTGHLLLSTLHTNTAVQAIARLVDIGVDPALIGSSLIGVVGQRLVRRTCERCKEPYRIGSEEAIVLQEMQVNDIPETLHRGRGCAHCHGTGYFGRVAVHEVIVVDEALRRLIARGVDSSQLLDHVVGCGFKDLRHDAARRLLAGETTLREVMRVTV